MTEIHYFIFITFLWIAGVYFILGVISGNKKVKEDSTDYISEEGVFFKEWRFALFCAGAFLFLIALLLYQANTLIVGVKVTNIISILVGICVGIFGLIKNKIKTGKYLGISAGDSFFVFSHNKLGRWIKSILVLTVILIVFIALIIILSSVAYKM